MESPSMGEEDYTKRELDTKFQAVTSVIEESVRDLKEVLGRIETQTIKTNGRVTSLETRESERRGASKWMIGVFAFIASILVSYLAWLGAQVFSIHTVVQQAVSDALLPYAK